MMKTKTKPQRTCIVCRQMQDKENLIRIVKNAEGDFFVDPTGKANGRGAYVCKNADCFAKLKKQKGLSRAFKCQINEDIYNKIEGEIFESSEN